MKLALVIFSLISVTSSAFLAPVPLASSKATALAAASGMFGPHGPRLGQESTEPVADRKVSRAEVARMKDVVLDPDYRLAISVACLCPLILWYHPSYYEDGSLSVIGVAGAAFHLLFAALLWVQTRRVRCVFEKDGFEFKNIKGYKLDLEQGAKLVEKPGNYVTGTKNKWNYDKIINYGFFPSFEFPVIVYFKETETSKDHWNKWFAAFDSYQRGQPHFFPGICDVSQFREQMQARGVKRKPVRTFKDAAKKQ